MELLDELLLLEVVRGEAVDGGYCLLVLDQEGLDVAAEGGYLGQAIFAFTLLRRRLQTRKLLLNPTLLQPPHQKSLARQLHPTLLTVIHILLLNPNLIIRRDGWMI